MSRWLAALAALVLLVPLVMWAAAWRFEHHADHELQAFLPESRPLALVSEADLDPLPPPVQHWLRSTGVLGRPAVQVARLDQSGELRTTPDGVWMPFSAEQHTRVDDPGFFWTARVHAGPVHLLGRDRWAEGRGQMLIKLEGLLPIADAKGPATDQASLLRWLGEICWLPSAALHPSIRWEALDDRAARATLQVGEVQAEGVYTFDETGALQRFEAMRYYDRPEGATLERWRVDTVEQGVRGGLRIPTVSRVTWVLPEGEFHWLDIRIDDAEYLPGPLRQEG